MKIYIPEHLKSIHIIKQLYEMIKSYGEDIKWNQVTPSSFDNYKFSLKTDPVISFLDLILPSWVDLVRNGVSSRYDPINKTVYTIENNTLTDTGFWDDKLLPVIEEERKKKISYLSSMFYSVKGTFKVLEYLKLFGIFGNSLKDIRYTTKSIDIKIDSINVDRDQFFSMIEAFLGTLLYFEELNITIGESKIEFNGELKVNIDTGEFYYKYEKVII